jgi:hypothetical protein
LQLSNIDRLRDLPLLPIGDCRWHEDDVPLGERGVSIDWLEKFFNAIDQAVWKLWDQYEEARKRFIHWDHPLPETPPFEKTNFKGDTNIRKLVHDFVVPLTAQLRVPLYARVPPKYRGKPMSFVSHVWDIVPMGKYGTLGTLTSGEKLPGPVWIDFVCYNQHSVTSVAKDMASIIEKIGRVDLLITRKPFYSRLWCVWEFLCAHQTGAKVFTHEVEINPTKEHHVMRTPFVSIADAETSLAVDRQDILDAVSSTFGSISKANKAMRLAVESPSLVRAAEHAESSGDSLGLGQGATVPEVIDMAIRSYRGGVDARKQLIEYDPDNGEWQHDLAVTYTKLAEAYGRSNNLEEAEAVLRLAGKIMTRLVKLSPDNSTWKSELTTLQKQIAGL